MEGDEAWVASFLSFKRTAPRSWTISSRMEQACSMQSAAYAQHSPFLDNISPVRWTSELCWTKGVTYPSLPLKTCSFLLNLFMYSLVCLCVSMMGVSMCATEHVWRSKDNCVELVLSFSTFKWILGMELRSPGFWAHLSTELSCRPPPPSSF